MSGTSKPVALPYESGSTSNPSLLRHPLPMLALLVAIGMTVAAAAVAMSPRFTFGQQLTLSRVALGVIALAMLGVVFAISGVYGMVALDVGRRIREVGLRLALGATARDVVAGVIRRGLAPVVAGGLAGGIAAVWTGPYLEDLLFQVPARDPWSLAAGFALVSLTAVLASSLPARRASRVVASSRGAARPSSTRSRTPATRQARARTTRWPPPRSAS